VKPVWKFIVARLSEASTIRGLLMLLTAGGIVLKPDAVDAIVSVGLSLAGLFGVVMPDTAPPVQ
jgi:hypothetical protein